MLGVHSTSRVDDSKFLFFGELPTTAVYFFLEKVALWH